MIGQRLLHYQILEKLGEGGMGVIYKGLDVRLDRPVAIKVLPPSHLGDADRKRRFVHEAKAASALNHPNIVTVYDIDAAGDIDFMAMEYVPGVTLRERIGRKRLPLADTLRYLTQVADALSAAHAAGIVHRDLKPENIMIAENGLVKLLDFGLAKLTETSVAAAAASTVTVGLTLTEPGMVLGTVAYMSPEQARGQPVDQRADVWAFGCVLFETLSGHKAFEGSTRTETLVRILESEPDWAALPESIPASIRQLIRSCLRKDAQHRLRHIDPVQLELTSEPTALTRFRGTGRQAALGAAILAMGAALGWVAHTTMKTAPPVRQGIVRFASAFSAPVLPAELNFPLVALAPDGGSIVHAGQSAGGETQLFLRRADRLREVPLAGTEGSASPFFSADGKYVGFCAGDKLKRVSIADGAVQVLCKAPSVFGGAWGRNNIIVFGTVSRGLMRVAGSGGTPEPLTELGPGEASHRWPSLSPSGSVVVYTTSNSTGPGLEEPSIVAQSLDSGKRQVLPLKATFAWFAPGGDHLLVVQDGAVNAVAFDSAQLKIVGAPVLLLEGVMQSNSGAAQIGSSNSTLAYLPGALESRRLVWVDRQGQVEPLDAPPHLYVHPRLSPDGKKVAVVITEPKNDIWIYDIAQGGGALRRLTVEGNSNAYPIWSRDGKKITYVSSQGGKPPNLFWINADGTGKPERMLTSPNTQVSETWAPGDKDLLFVELRAVTTKWDILALSPGGTPREILATPFHDTTPQISPSGRYLAHGSDESGSMQLQVHSFPDLVEKVVVGPGSQAGWRADERELYFRQGDAMMAATVTRGPRLSIGKPRVLFQGAFANIQGKNYDVTSDGKRFLMVRTDLPVPPKEITVVLNWMEELRSRLPSK